MKTYISGKITGYDISFAEHKFLLTETILKHNGFNPVNPFKISPISDNKTWKDYMIDDIKALLDCEAIYMQNDWGQSKGARIEYQIAKEIGLKIMFEGDNLN